jgi:large subunit ribosomal protein L24
MKLKKGDTVLVTKGKDKGKQGNIEKIFPKTGKVLIPEVNLYKRHIKKNVTGQASEIVTITKPVPAANVALICPKCKKQTRIGYKVEKGLKIRVCRKCKKEI